MHNINAPRHISLETWRFLVMNQTSTVIKKQHFADFSPRCFCVFVRIKNGLKILNFYKVRGIQQKATAGPRVIINKISRGFSTKGNTAVSRVFVQKGSTGCDWLRSYTYSK
jgi:hypothetical protein